MENAPTQRSDRAALGGGGQRNGQALETGDWDWRDGDMCGSLAAILQTVGLCERVGGLPGAAALHQDNHLPAPERPHRFRAKMLFKIEADRHLRALICGLDVEAERRPTAAEPR